MPAGVSEALRERIRGFGRQALHAESLSLKHPQSGETLTFTAEPPADFDMLLRALYDELGHDRS